MRTNPTPFSTLREPWLLRESPTSHPAFYPLSPLTRVAVFGSFMGGYHVLQELLFGPLAGRVQVVGVASDDPTQPFTHPNVRLWHYPHSRDDETTGAVVGQINGIAVYALAQ